MKTIIKSSSNNNDDDDDDDELRARVEVANVTRERLLRVTKLPKLSLSAGAVSE